MLKNLVCISIGASAGAMLRWCLGLWLNAIFPPIPMGTLAANILGAYWIGIAVGVFNLLPGLGPEWRLLVITGFLGGLTTLSTFTAELGTLLQEQRLALGMLAVAAHVLGSLAAFFGGAGTVVFLKSLMR